MHVAADRQVEQCTRLRAVLASCLPSAARLAHTLRMQEQIARSFRATALQPVVTRGNRAARRNAGAASNPSIEATS